MEAEHLVKMEQYDYYDKDDEGIQEYDLLSL